MNRKLKRVLYFSFGTILAVTAVSQAMNGNLLLFVFPCIGSVSFFVSALKMNM